MKAALADPARQFVRGPRTLSKRGTADDEGPAFVVEDGRYVSARWPGDAYAFSRAPRSMPAPSRSPALQTDSATPGVRVGRRWGRPWASVRITAAESR